MQNFTFHNPTRILFGAGQIGSLRREVPHGVRILLTYGGGSIKANGVYDQVKRALEGFDLLEFGGIEPNPTFETLMKGVELARREKVEFLLAVGGGSVLDGTKFIAAAVPYQGNEWDIVGRHMAPRAALPMGTVLTLPATGSEANCYAVVTKAATREKIAFSSPLLFPRFSIMDPETTYSLPPRQIANGVVDAFAHTCEQYLTYAAEAPLQDRFAEAILRTLVEEGPRTLADPRDYVSRSNVMWCATQALGGAVGAGVPQDWATHAIGHELTALHGLDHAQTLAVILPNLLWVQRVGKREKLAQYAERVWDIRDGSEAVRIEKGIIATRAFFETMGSPTHLGAYGVDESHFGEIVERLRNRMVLPLGERKDITHEKVMEILALAR
jgi:NADP-dependent alcohol dehydrogenase